MAKAPAGRKRRESSSSGGAAAIKADPEEDEQVATNSKTTTSACTTGLIFKEEVLNRRVQVLFDVDTGKDDEPMAHQWYEGTITAVQLELANVQAKAGAGGGGGKRGGKRGAKSKSAESRTSTDDNTKLKATHQVAFDDGDVRWFDLVYWTGKGELKWVGDAPTPVCHSTIDPNAGSKTVGTGTEESTTASSSQKQESADKVDLSATCTANPSPLVSPNRKRSAAENNSSSIGEQPQSPAKKRSKAASPPQQESPPHTLIHGTKYYVV